MQYTWDMYHKPPLHGFAVTSVKATTKQEAQEICERETGLALDAYLNWEKYRESKKLECVQPSNGEVFGAGSSPEQRRGDESMDGTNGDAPAS